MPYPMAPMPSLDAFVQTACNDYEAEERGVDSRGPKGPVKHRYLIRAGRVAVLPDMEGDDRLTPSVLRSLCNRLGIPLEAFNLELD